MVNILADEIKYLKTFSKLNCTGLQLEPLWLFSPLKYSKGIIYLNLNCKYLSVSTPLLLPKFIAHNWALLQHCWPEPAAAVSKKGCVCDKELDSPGVRQY